MWFDLGHLPPGQRAIWDPRALGYWTYGDLRQASQNWVEFLGDSSSKKKLIFLFCKNRVNSLIKYLAALRSGHAVALFDLDLHADFKRRLIERYRPDTILGDAGFGFEHCDYLAREKNGFRAWERTTPVEETIAAELALLLPTSGTTGSPKMVRLSFANLECNARSISEYLGLDASERALAGLPLHYSYGLSVVNSHLLVGASLVFAEAGPMQKEFWELARSQNVTSLAGVPYTFQMLSRLGLEKLAPASLKTLTQAGGKLTPELIQQFSDLQKKRGGKFYVMYGQTEATARISYVPAEKLGAKLGSVGIAIPGGRIAIEHQGKLTQEPELTGEVIYQGPNVMLGYAEERGDLSRGDDLGGVLRTGDLGHLDQDGYLFITGRNKRISKLYGLRINLDEIELRLRGFGPTAALEGKDKIHIFCEFGDPALYETMRRDLSGAYGLNPRSFELSHLPELPRTASGKIAYAQLSPEGRV